ncbi:MAG TPA: sulfatase [Steroidobacteraceae bacterium]
MLATPLIGLLVADKAFKLIMVERSVGPARLQDFSSFGPEMIARHNLVVLGVVIAVVGVLLSHLLGRRRGKVGVSVGWLLSLPLIYAATVLGSVLHADAEPFDPSIWQAAVEELGNLLALWWREGLIAAFIIAALSWHFASASQRPARWRTIALGGLLVLGCLVVGVDFGYFIATGVQLTNDDVGYAISAPRETWFVAHGSISALACLPLTIALIGTAMTYLALVWHRPKSKPAGPPRHTVPLAPLVGAAIALSIAAPALPSDVALKAYTDSPLLHLTIDELPSSLRRRFALGMGGSISKRVQTLTFGPVTTARTATTRKLNVVIVMLESTRADATTVYSPGLATTPFLAQLARESLVVDNMYAVIPRTSAAWVAILSGRYPASHEVIKEYASRGPVPQMQSSLPVLLRAQGYQSAFFTSTTPFFENDRDILRSLAFDKVVTQLQIPPPSTGLVTPFGWEDLAVLPPIGHWLDTQVSRGTPFLLTVMTNVGHHPYGLPSGFPIAQYTRRNPQQNSYLNCIRYIDGFLHQLVDELRARGLLDNTVLMILGDHGEEFQEHGGHIHGFALYDESLHIPLLIRLPPADGRTGHVRGLRQQIDILPTVTDALGLTLQGTPLPGKSILGSAGHDALFFSTHSERSSVAMRDISHKYIYSFDKNVTKVFDLSRDPGELDDVRAATPAATISQVETDLLAWHHRVNQSYLGRTGEQSN